MGKLCLYCREFYLDLGSPSFSEVSLGSDWSMSCLKDHWLFNPFNESERTFKRTLETGLTCLDFKEETDAQEESNL